MQNWSLCIGLLIIRQVVSRVLEEGITQLSLLIIRLAPKRPGVRSHPRSLILYLTGPQSVYYITVVVTISFEFAIKLKPGAEASILFLYCMQYSYSPERGSTKTENIYKNKNLLMSRNTVIWLQICYRCCCCCCQVVFQMKFGKCKRFQLMVRYIMKICCRKGENEKEQFST